MGRRMLCAGQQGKDLGWEVESPGLNVGTNFTILSNNTPFLSIRLVVLLCGMVVFMYHVLTDPFFSLT